MRSSLELEFNCPLELEVLEVLEGFRSVTGIGAPVGLNVGGVGALVGNPVGLLVEGILPEHTTLQLPSLFPYWCEFHKASHCWIGRSVSFVPGTYLTLHPGGASDMLRVWNFA